jgi:hypothetical protein
MHHYCIFSTVVILVFPVSVAGYSATFFSSDPSSISSARRPRRVPRSRQIDAQPAELPGGDESMQSNKLIRLVFDLIELLLG